VLSNPLLSGVRNWCQTLKGIIFSLFCLIGDYPFLTQKFITSESLFLSNGQYIGVLSCSFHRSEYVAPSG
jgi:hypothetical protein